MKKSIFNYTILIMLLLCPLTIQAQKTAKPKDGDGITTFLQRYRLNTPVNIKEFKKINKGKFTSDGGLILGRTYLLPQLEESDNKEKNEKGKRQKRKKEKTNSREPLFGKR